MQVKESFCASSVEVAQHAKAGLPEDFGSGKDYATSVGHIRDAMGRACEELGLDSTLTLKFECFVDGSPEDGRCLQEFLEKIKTVVAQAQVEERPELTMIGTKGRPGPMPDLDADEPDPLRIARITYTIDAMP